MHYVPFGRTGVKVSPLTLGCMMFGGKTSPADSARIIDRALDAGINILHTANVYNEGRSEEVTGAALKANGRRRRVFLATKVHRVMDATDPNAGGLSRRHIIAECEASLRRLQTDYIDLYQLHIPDPTVPIADTLGALHELVTAGKVRVIGCSNLSLPELEEADRVAAELGVDHFASIQAPLNIFSRGILRDIMPACERLGLAFIPYYPLASGLLTGKYGHGRPPASGTRLTDQMDEATRNKLLNERTFARIDALEDYARDRGHTLIELAFAWLLSFPAVAPVIAGIARPGQAASNANAAGWQLTREEADEVIGVVTAAV
jgi:aryl-alcohol dehydrogenase-like predicted oxidoreductase